MFLSNSTHHDYFHNLGQSSKILVCTLNDPELCAKFERYYPKPNYGFIPLEKATDNAHVNGPENAEELMGISSDALTFSLFDNFKPSGSESEGDSEGEREGESEGEENPSKRFKNGNVEW